MTRRIQVSAEPELSEEHFYWLRAGHVCIGLHADEYEALKGDLKAQTALIEEEAGASIALVSEFQELEGHIRCCALTKSGGQCSNFIKGRWSQLDFAGWLAMREKGGYCFIHQDRTMNVEAVEQGHAGSQ